MKSSVHCFILLVVSCAAYQVKTVEKYAISKHKKCDRVADIALVIDSSSSINAADYKKGIKFLADFVSGFKIRNDKVRFAAIPFSRGIHPEHAFRFVDYTDRKSLIKAIRGLPHMQGNYTSTGEGIKYMRETLMEGARPDVPHIGIVITDGQSQNWAATRDEAKKAKTVGITMFAIGVGPDVNDDELKNIASGQKYIIKEQSYSQLSDNADTLVQEICPAPKDEQCDRVADIALVIDSSVSIDTPDYQKGIQFLADFVNGFDVGHDEVRFAGIPFSLGIHTQHAFRFVDYTDITSLVKAIRSLPHMQGNYTSTEEGIKYMRETLMKDARPDVPHIGIVITDGQSQKWKATRDEAKEAKTDGITMIAIGVGPDVNDDELKNIASGQKYIIKEQSYSQLADHVDSLVGKICAEVPTRPPQNDEQVPTRPPQNDEPCGWETDVYFMYDEKQLGAYGIGKVTEFVSNVVEKQNSKGMYYGTITVCDSDDGFSLDQWTFKDVERHFDRAYYTSASKLLKILNDRTTFSPKKGNRQTARKIAVLFVDSKLGRVKLAKREARKARRNNVTLYVVNMGGADMFAKSLVDSDRFIGTGDYSAFQYANEFIDQLC